MVRCAASLLLLTLLLSCVTASLGRRLSQSAFDRLVATPSAAHGLREKKGVLPQWKYTLDHFDRQPFDAWLRQTWLGNTREPVDPPMSYRCGVYVNHAYRIIFIRNRKTASSTLLAALGKNDYCAQHTSTGNCFELWAPENATLAGYADPDSIWRDYLVISQSRNPWSRAASGYDYTFALWQNTTGGCSQPSFRKFTQDPMIMGKISNLFECAKERHTTIGKPDSWNHDFYHVEPAYHCLTDEQGQNVADFIVRYEHLEDDLDELVTVINDRAPAGVPKLQLHRLAWQKRGTAARTAGSRSSDDAAYVHAQKYRRCGWKCVEDIQRFFSRDLDFFGWQPAERLSPELGGEEVAPSPGAEREARARWAA